MGSRIIKIRGERTRPEFAEQFGVHKSTLERYEKGGTSPDAVFIAALMDQEAINPTWLLTGEGAMRLKGEPAPPTAEPVAGLPAPQADDYIYIPLYDVRASAGGGAFNEHEEPAELLAFRRQWIRQTLGADPKWLCLLYVAGESMEPTLHSGDTVLVNRADSKADDGIYAMALDGHLLIKRLQCLPGRKVKVISDNSAYEPFVMDEAGLELVGRVIWTGRKI